MTVVHYITNLDFSILDYIQSHFKCEFLDFLMPFLSFIGEAGVIWAIIAAAFLVFKKYRAYGIMMLISLGITFLLGELIFKNVFCRIRPCYINLNIEMLVNKPRSYSFPSGHTGSSFTAATVIFLADKRFGIAALVLASLIAFSRLYNYVHYPTDVLAGIILGVAVGIAVYKVFERYSINNKIENFRFNRNSKRG